MKEQSVMTGVNNLAMEKFHTHSGGDRWIWSNKENKPLTETNTQTIPQTYDLYILTVTLRCKKWRQPKDEHLHLCSTSWQLAWHDSKGSLIPNQENHVRFNQFALSLLIEMLRIGRYVLCFAPLKQSIWSVIMAPSERTRIDTALVIKSFKPTCKLWHFTYYKLSENKTYLEHKPLLPSVRNRELNFPIKSTWTQQSRI